MKTERWGAGIAGIIFGIGFGLSLTVPAEAACRQVLAPNRWQYITVCDGNRGGADYSGAVAAGVVAGAIAIEMLPGVLGAVGDITSGVGDVTSGVVGNVTSGVGDVTSGVVGNLGNAATNVTAPVGEANFNPFNIFSQQQDVPCNENDRKRGCRNIRGNAAAFGADNNNNDQQYVVDPGGCSANRAVFGGCQKMKPKQTCDASGCYIEYVAVPPPPNKKGKNPPNNRNKQNAGEQSPGLFNIFGQTGN